MNIHELIKALECIAEDRQKSCTGCEYSFFGLYPFCVHGIARDTLALLKEQEDALEQMRLDNTDLRNCNAELLKEHEAVKPKSKVRHGANAQIQHFCGNCNSMLYGKPKYCRNCGKQVKWE